MKLPPAFQVPDRTIASVTWNIADVQDDESIRNAKIALTRYMRKKHPGRKYRVVKAVGRDLKTASFLAVPLDG